MLTTTLSSKGQIIIPKPLRRTHQWKTGQEFIIVETKEGLLLKPKNPFPLTTLDEVIATLHYEGDPKTLDEMEQAIQLGAMETVDKKLINKAKNLDSCDVCSP